MFSGIVKSSYSETAQVGLPWLVHLFTGIDCVCISGSVDESWIRQVCNRYRDRHVGCASTRSSLFSLRYCLRLQWSCSWPRSSAVIMLCAANVTCGMFVWHVSRKNSFILWSVYSTAILLCFIIRGHRGLMPLMGGGCRTSIVSCLPDLTEQKSFMHADGLFAASSNCSLSSNGVRSPKPVNLFQLMGYT